MFVAILLAATALLACVTTAAPVVTAALTTTPPYQITDLAINKQDPGNITIAFKVYDPDPLTNSTAWCTGTWKVGSGGYPQGPYDICGNTTFAWNMASYTNMTNFVLGVEHLYEDPAVGSPPWDEITNFGHGNVTKAVLECVPSGANNTCSQAKGNIISAPIYATTAKQR